MSERPTVAVIGGGFSGLMTALHLLDDPSGPRVRLVERAAGFGLGAAYASRCADHLLNVRAANMSARPERPHDFVDWLAARGRPQEVFVSRGVYGAYLQDMLRAAARGAQAGRLALEADGAVDLSRADEGGGGWRVTLAMGRTVAADAAVLAIGNPPPDAPASLQPCAQASPAYVADPWSDAVDRLPETGTVLLLGTGLTMVDAALRLERARPGLRMLAVSRRGLLPRRHLAEGPAPEPWAPACATSPAAVLAELRDRARDRDWRRVVDGLRPRVQEVWRGWSLEERRRFLRHLRPWWDVHRHRVAPQVASRLDHLTGGGRLSTCAGRIERITAAGEELEVRWTPRASRSPRTVRVAGVVNCTGPAGDLARSSDPLLAGLAAQGLARADNCRLGLEVDARGRLMGADGRAHPTLFGVGPVTRGAFWEITSVPDIRVQAAACAGFLREALARPPVWAH